MARFVFWGYNFVSGAGKSAANCGLSAGVIGYPSWKSMGFEEGLPCNYL